MGCSEFGEVASEFALGLLDGQERADALAHLDRCPACRTLADELAQAADALTLVAPPAEPPAGFETRVLARLDDVPRRRQWWRRPIVGPIVGIAAALLVVVAAVGLFRLGTGNDDDPGAARHQWAVGTMHTAEGEDVGVVVVDGRRDGFVQVRVNRWDKPGVDYFVKLDYADGESQQLLLTRLEYGGFEAALPERDEHVTEVSMVKADGTVLCHGAVEY